MSERQEHQVEVLISPIHGPSDPPKIGVTFRDGRKVLATVELTAENFGLALTGRLVHGQLTRFNLSNFPNANR